MTDWTAEAVSNAGAKVFRAEAELEAANRAADRETFLARMNAGEDGELVARDTKIALATIDVAFCRLRLAKLESKGKLVRAKAALAYAESMLKEALDE